jgi:hypothetical protein
MYLLAQSGEGLGLMARSEYTNACKRRHPKRTREPKMLLVLPAVGTGGIGFPRHGHITLPA